MPSSISNSEARRWRVIWLVALSVAAAVVFTWEGYWRSRGFEASIGDDLRGWAIARSRVYEGGRDAVVLVGSSRMQFAINRRAFVETTGWREPVQLAFVQGPSLPILRDLVSDEGFTGTVICEVNPALFFLPRAQMEWYAAPYLARYASLSWGDRLEQSLTALAQQTFVFRRSALAPKHLFGALQQGVAPAPSHISVDGSRFRFADFEKSRDLELQNRQAASIRKWTPVRLLPPAQLEARLEETEALVQELRERGGEVVFVQLPSNGHIRADDERRAPRNRYWDALATNISAPAIHYADHPELAGFTSPDGEHLARADAIEFTRALGDVLNREFEGRPGAQK